MTSKEKLWLPVWACDHQWKKAIDGNDRDAREEISGAAFNFLVDIGENVSLCDSCEENVKGIVVTRMEVLDDEEELEWIRDCR